MAWGPLSGSSSQVIASAGPAGLTYEGAYINRSGETGASNSTISLKFSEAVPAGDYTTGITIEVTGDNRSNYETLNLSNTTQAVRDTNYVQYTITSSAVVDTFQGLSGTEGHQVRISATADSFCGEITAGAGSSETLTNASTINLLEGIVAFWKMEEASGTRYDAVGSANLTDNNGVASAAADDPPYLDNSAVLNRTDSDSLTVANESLAAGDFDFVIACWAKPSAIQSDDGIVGRWQFSSGNYREYLIYNSPGNTINWYVSQDGNNSSSVTSTATIANDNWYSIITQHDNGTNIQISVNNETNVVTGHTSGAMTAVQDFEVGRYNGSTGYWSGRVDALGFWKSRLFAADERTDWYNGGDGKQYPFLPDYT